MDRIKIASELVELAKEMMSAKRTSVSGSKVISKKDVFARMDDLMERRSYRGERESPRL